MIATSHVIIGGAAGIAAGALTGGNPFAALAAGIVSHLICDAVPHWDHPDAPKINGELVWTKAVYIFAVTDSGIGAIFTFATWGLFFDFNFMAPFVWGAGGGYLPDFIDNMPLWKDYFRTKPGFRHFHAFHEWIHDLWQWKYPMPEYFILGTVTQLAVAIPCLWYIFN
jgi:hypothetical protein